MADKGAARVGSGWRLPRAWIVVPALLGAALVLYGGRLALEPLEAAVGDGVELDDAQAKLALCVIDADQTAFFILRAINFIGFSVENCRVMLDVESRSACAATVATSIASFGWTATYAASAVSTCGSKMNVPALCATAVSGFLSDITELTALTNFVVNACNLPALPPSDLLADENARAPGRRRLEGGAAFYEVLRSSAQEPSPAPGEVGPLRGWRISQCVVNLDFAVASLSRIGITIYFLSLECPETGEAYDRKRCALDIFNLIAAAALTALALASAVVDCPEVPATMGAACAGVVSDFVAMVLLLGPTVDGIKDDCPAALTGGPPLGPGFADFA